LQIIASSPKVTLTVGIEIGATELDVAARPNPKGRLKTQPAGLAQTKLLHWICASILFLV
jgi:hypothetical protein